MTASAPRTPASNQGAVADSSLMRFARPRYWPTWLFLGWLWFAAHLPHRVMIKLHKALGRLLGRLVPAVSHVARCNLQLCFPALGTTEREHLVRRHCAALGASLGEIGAAWFASERHLHRLYTVRGLEHVQAALAAGRGVLVYGGHFTPLEICGPALMRAFPDFVLMYAHRSNALLDAMQRRGRTRTSHACIHTGDVRALLRALARNAVVWYAPDQAARGTHTLLVPFFGEPAMTLSATSRIARMSGTAVVPVSYCRRPDDSGYDIEFFPALEDFPTDEIEADTRRLVGILEGFIRACPEQYLWSHKKFRYRPAPWPDPYRRRTPSRESSAP